MLSDFEKQFQSFGLLLRRELSVLFRQGVFTKEAILRVFDRNGYSELAEDFINGQAELLRFGAELSRELGFGVTLSERSIGLLAVVSDQNLSNLLNTRDAIINTMIDAGLKNELNGTSFQGIVMDLEGKIDELGRRLATEAQTGISTFDRTIKSEHFASAGIEKFIYVGPLDKKTREVCADVLTDARNTDSVGFSRAEIIGLNGVSFITGGGFNCRHEWLPAVLGAERLVG